MNGFFEISNAIELNDQYYLLWTGVSLNRVFIMCSDHIALVLNYIKL